MRILTLKILDKVYTTGKINAYLSKEVIRAAKQSIVIAKKQSEVKGIDGDDDMQLDIMASLMDDVEDLTARKSWIICEAYGNKFTGEELERELSTEEIDQEINKIMGAITGTMGKN